MSLTKAGYIALVNSLLPDNSSQLISPADVRTSLFSLVDSVNNFLSGQIIDTATISDIDVRTVRAGNLSIEKFASPGRYNEDNSAFGYYALGGNYNGIANTAVGSYAIGCNLYGDHNVGIGYNSLAGNINGSGNVGIGNHTLQSNKHGSFNIAIGHGAGHYIGQSQNYKLYIAAHEINPEVLCDPLIQSGTPLIHGDLKYLRLGIGTKTLDSFGTLQVNGTITPTKNFNGNLGHPTQQWANLYLSSGIGYSGGFYIGRIYESYPSQYDVDKTIYINANDQIGIGTDSPLNALMTIDGDVLPKITNTYSLGNENYKWNGVFNNVVISGNAIINHLDYTTIESCLYHCKTLHLASSGICEDDIFDSTICGYLTDEELDGAGFEAHASGVDYVRTYRYIYKFPDPTLNCVEDNHYARSRWFSNISIELDSGRAFIADTISSRDKLSITTNSGCYGLFIRPGSDLPRISFGDQSALSHLNNDEFNFLHPSGFSVLYKTASSGIEISQDFISRGNTNNYRGFKIKYYDTKDTVSCGQITDRLSITSIDSNSLYEPVTILRNNGHYQSGVFGITNIVGQSILPRTIFNVQAQSGCEVRFSSKQPEKTKLQLLSNGNAPYSGVQITYTPTIGSTPYSQTTNINVDFSLLYPSGSANTCGIETPYEEGFLEVAENGYIGIGKTKSHNTRIFLPNAPLTIYHDDPVNSGTISLHEQTYAPTATADYGKVYVKPFIISDCQTQSLFFKDDGGNEFNLITNLNDTNNGLLYGDNNFNTYGGIDCPQSRPTINAYSNTAIGHSALYSITTGSRNIAIGHRAASGINTGEDNVIIGKDAARFFISARYNTIVGSECLASYSANGTGNIIIGYRNLFNSTSSPQNIIAIGSGLYHSSTIPDNTLVIGFGSKPLISGNANISTLSNRFLTVSQSKFSTTSQYDDQQFILDHTQEASRYVTSIKIKDNINANTNDGFLSLRFLDKNDKSRTLMDFDHKANAMTITPTFAVASPVRPFVTVSGDLRVLGAIRFANGTSVEDGNLDIELNFIDLPDALDTPDEITGTNSYLALSVPSGDGDYVGKINLEEFSDLIGSGFAKVGNNCNHIFTNIGNGINVVKNSNSVFIGCDVGANATGWKHAVMIGSEAGYGATTQNTDLASDNAPIFIGMQAGKNSQRHENAIYIGNNAGKYSTSGNQSIYIGSNAGTYSSYKNSIGIGENALRGNVSTNETGRNNIEIITGLLDNQRLLYNLDVSNKLNIQNTIAGDTSQRILSIGNTTINPDAVLSVRKHNILHPSLEYIQTWWCEANKAAAIDCSGNRVVFKNLPKGFPSILEGTAEQNISAPSSPSSPTQGWFLPRGETWGAYDTAIRVYNRDTKLTITSGTYMIAEYINGTYRPIWVSC